MNLSTARASQRAREVALRKVMGARRTQVGRQFLLEALSLAILALVVALVAVELLLPAYGEVLGKEITFSYREDSDLLLLFAGVTFLTGILSGIYPAFVLSRYLPAKVLKSSKTADAEGSSKLRSALVVFQFAVSIGLVVCTGVVYGQTLFARTMDPGYTFENKLVLQGMFRSGMREVAEPLRQRIEALPGVESVVFSSEAPTQDFENNRQLELLDSADDTGQNRSQIINYYRVDHNFFDAYGVKPAFGRTFDKNRPIDTWQLPEEGQSGAGTIMLNETATRALGFGNPADAVGRTVRTSTGDSEEEFMDLEIVGVIPDIYFRSIRFGIRPGFYYVDPGAWNVATVSYETSDVNGLASEIEAIWRDLAPQVPFSYEHLDEMIAAQYASDEAQATLFAAFSVLAVVIASLGLYGLATFTAVRRTREIGIRKVLGATVRDIVSLLTWQFSKPVLLANILAWPVAFWVMSGWLEGFTYRIGVDYIISASLAAGIVALLIAWATVASRAFRVARTNPIHALRYE